LVIVLVCRVGNEERGVLLFIWGVLVLMGKLLRKLLLSSLLRLQWQGLLRLWRLCYMMLLLMLLLLLLPVLLLLLPVFMVVQLLRLLSIGSSVQRVD
jgi:hypothetical protein